MSEIASYVELTPLQEAQLEALEGIIQRGLGTFIEVGNALMSIRDLKLYQADFKTFEDYCRDRWNLTRPRAYQLMEAAEVVGNLSTIVDTPGPVNEAQARPLTRLEPDQQREAWTQAVETAPNGKVTAAHVERVVESIAPRKPGPADEPCAPVFAAWEPEETDEAPETPEAITEPARDKHAVHFTSVTDEHWTPREVVAAAIEVLGAIDLDPCSNGGPEPNVPAVKHFTQADDGLTQEWHGRVYMNPPYGREIPGWVEKLVAELEAGRLTEAIALVPARTDTQWWKTLNDFPFCLVEGRLTFINNDDPAPFPSAIFYLGPNVDRFCEVFEAFGSSFRKMFRGMDYAE